MIGRRLHAKADDFTRFERVFPSLIYFFSLGLDWIRDSGLGRQLVHSKPLLFSFGKEKMNYGFTWPMSLLLTLIYQTTYKYSSLPPMVSMNS